MLEIDRPDVLAEVRDAVDRYEAALVGNDVAALDDVFWRDARALRYGPTESLHGHAEIAAFRAARATTDLERVVTRTIITSYGSDVATANVEFTRVASGRRGRQSQTWVRMAGGWRVVAAHVSFLPDGAAS